MNHLIKTPIVEPPKLQIIKKEVIIYGYPPNI